MPEVAGRQAQGFSNDPLGTLENRLRRLLSRNPNIPQLADFVTLLGPARETRNDLLHALPVKDGLHRRKSNDPRYVRNFFTIDDVQAVVVELTIAWTKGSNVLYADGGAAVRAWAEAGGS